MIKPKKITTIELTSGVKEAITFIDKKGGICDWNDPDLNREMMDKLGEGIEIGIIGSYCETETYMVNRWMIEGD